jgi:hypothetical protein
MVSEYKFDGEIIQDIASAREFHYRVGPVVDGADVMQIYVIPDGPSPQMKLNGELALTVVFGDGTDLRVLETLAEIGDWVQHIIDRIAEAYPERPTFDAWKATLAHAGPS